MRNDEACHRTLERQIRKLGVPMDDGPSPAQWQRLVGAVSASYAEADSQRYTMERSIEVASNEMRSLYEVLSHQACHDTLTGLLNRGALIETLCDYLLPGRQTSQACAVLFIDLDGFKLVNDSLGHSAGDALLVRTAERIRSTVRDNDVAARLGGDEFVIVCAGVDGLDVAEAMARRVGSELRTPFRIGTHDAGVSASIGIALARPGEGSADQVLQQADAAMYRAKTLGRDRYVVFDDDMRQDSHELSCLSADLQRAVELQQLEVHLQPVFRLADAEVVGMEALVRWNRPAHGLMDPATFLPIASKSRLIADIDCWMLHEACRQIAAQPEYQGFVSVNLSYQSMRADAVVTTISTALQRSGLAPQRLVIELPEAALMSDQASTQACLRRIEAIGVKVALDDFGTGISSLTSLMKLGAKTLKIDGELIDLLGAPMDAGATPGRNQQTGRDNSERAAGDRATAVVGALVDLAHGMGFDVVAEGVERVEQARILLALGCDFAQGHFFASPMPPAEAFRNLERSWSDIEQPALARA